MSLFESKLLINIQSTICIEGIKYNKKILYVDCSPDNRFAYFGEKYKFNNICLYNEENLNNLEKRIVDLLNMKFSEYKKISKDFENFINQPEENELPTYKKITNIIVQENFF